MSDKIIDIPINFEQLEITRTLLINRLNRIKRFVEGEPLIKDIILNEKLICDLLTDSIKTSRCCGRCDGVNDMCVSDRICANHSIMGCEICFGKK